MTTKSTHDKDLSSFRGYLETILISSGHDTMQELRKRIDFAEMSRQEFAVTTWAALVNGIQRHNLAKPEPLRPPGVVEIRLLMDENRFRQLVSGEVVEWQHEGTTIELILSDIGATVMHRHVDNGTQQRRRDNDADSNNEHNAERSL
jgi:hypothetical protein